MKIAYISHSGRPCYEFSFFSKVDCDEFVFIDSDFSRYPQNPPENIVYGKVNVEENAFLNFFFHSTASHVFYKDFERYLEGVDVIIVLEVFSSLAYQFTKYAKSKGIKVVSYVYELISEHLIYKIPPYLGYTNYVINNLDACITVSDMAKKHLMHLGMQESLITTIYPGINLNLFSHTGELKNGIIFVGKLEKHKGIDLFLKLIPQLIEKYQDIKIGVVGSGSYEQEVKMLARDYSDNVFCYGYVNNQDLPKILNKYKIYFFPIRDTYKFGFLKIGSEQFGFSLVEAMACGLQIVSSYCGAIPEILGKCGFLCSQDDESGFLSKLEYLISNCCDINGDALIRVKTYFDEHKQAKKIKVFLENIIS